MFLKSFFFLSLILFTTSALTEDLPRVLLKTSLGEIEIELNRDKAPVTVENFLRYVESGYYNNLIFHRVQYEWIIQGGGYDKDFNQYDVYEPIKNEADNGLKNLRGTIAMARNWDPHSADSQFFINLQDNPSFDHKGKSRRKYGYCVFGKVVRGMEVADAIGAVEKGEVEGIGINVPLQPVFIKSMKSLHQETP